MNWRGCSAQLMILLALLVSGCSEEQRDTARDKETVGTVSGASYKHIHYTVNGKEYKQRFERSSYGMMYEDEKFVLKYDSAAPDKIEICYDRPVFLETEISMDGVGKVIKIVNFRWPFGDEYKVRFTYTVGGVEYRREQIIPLNYATLYPDLKENGFYKLKYWINNPMRVCIDLSAPAQKGME